MNDVVLGMANSKLAKKKKTRKATQINIENCSSDEEWIMEDEHEQNEALDLDENLVLVEVEEDENLHSHDLHTTNLNGEGDGKDGFEGLYANYEFNLQDYLV